MYILMSRHVECIFQFYFFLLRFGPLFLCKSSTIMDPFQNRAFGIHVLLNGEKAKTRVERVLVFLVYMNIM
jgi:hypothetical protein